MKQVALKEDMYINGLGKIEKGTVFKVLKYNTRYVYVDFNRCTLQLSVKDIEIKKK